MSSRRSFLSGIAATAGLGAVSVSAQASKPHSASSKRKRPLNVLFIMSDDMNAELSCYGSLSRAQTPHLDELASSGVRFDRNYCQFPLCNPSRASLLTGRKPSLTTVLGNRTDVRAAHPDWVSLPQHFKENGYTTFRTGKIFHGGLDDPKAWTTVGFDEAKVAGKTFPDETVIKAPQEPVPPPPPGIPGPLPNHGGEEDGSHGAHSDRMLVVAGDGTGHPENHSADLAIEFLRKHGDRPFFLGCGFSKPHSPPEAPQSFYDLYDLDKLELPQNFDAWPTVPQGFPAASIRKVNADLFIRRGASELEAKMVLRAYLASISWVDWNIGRVLEALDEQGLRDNTVVVFVPDHGYQLGERGKWSKAGSLFEMGTRVPLIIRVPEGKGNGRSCYRTVQSLDLYPTLAEICGLPHDPQLQGRSLMPLLNDPSSAWDNPAFSIWSEDGHTVYGTAVRTERWRYVEFGEKAAHGAMLFDERADPLELTNLADDPAHASIRAHLSGLIAQYSADQMA
ncbi:MAG: sulfatase [Edaphobacter sp.]|uniref:sulfatase n=1 Tax=Edaphobacter sp. TaxID=1934404 RepID=UPI0023994D4E|nr:sulfatase [Edaphobacter sp.]MDE1177509.1 sulfatase [Edaphobacter sp.]